MTPTQKLMQMMQNAKLKQVYQNQRKTYAPQPERTAATLHMQGMGGQYDNPLMQYLLQQQAQITAKLQQAATENVATAVSTNQAPSPILPPATVNALANNITNGQVFDESARTMENNLAVGLDSALVPGNVGDINRVYWPYWFTTTKAVTEPNTSTPGNITVTQEAAFIWIAYSKAVFEETEVPNTYLYVDPSQAGNAGKSNNLSLLIRDSSSSRQFMNVPVNINNIGYWQSPTVLPTPVLFLPNSNIEFTFDNSDQETTYKTYVTMFGYRLRIENAQDLLGVVTS